MIHVSQRSGQANFCYDGSYKVFVVAKGGEGTNLTSTADMQPSFLLSELGLPYKLH